MKSDTRQQHVSVQQGCTTQSLILKEKSDSLVLECFTKSIRETQTFCGFILHRWSTAGLKRL